MKHLKLFESKIDAQGNLENALLEINDILYILNDEGIRTNSIINENPTYGKYIIINSNWYDGEYESSVSPKEIIKSDYFLEFIERVSSIGKLNGLNTLVCADCHVYVFKMNETWERFMKSKHFVGTSKIYFEVDELNEGMKHLKRLTEVIKLDIKVGDIVMGGRFKNKKIKVKKIGKNKKGDLCINGKPLLRFRIVNQERFNEKVEYHGTLGISKAYDDMVSLAKEIDDEIMYIMNDINVYPEMNIRYSQGGTNGAKTDRAWIDINVDKKYAETEEYLEFLDRMNDISKSFGCEVAHEEDRYGYILVYDPKTIDRSRWQIPMKVMESSKSVEEREASIWNVLDEIKELSYILKDEGIQYRFDSVHEKSERGVYTSLSISCPDDHQNKGFYNWWNNLLRSNDEFIEFLHRIREICNNHGFEIQIQGHSSIIYIYDPKFPYWEERNFRSELKIGAQIFESNLKQFNENKFSIDNLKKEIEDLNYILEDEGIYIDISIRQNGFEATGNYIYMPFYVSKRRWDDLISGGENGFFIEYLNRINEIASKYGHILYMRKDYLNIYIVSLNYIHWKTTIKNNIAQKILNQ